MNTTIEIVDPLTLDVATLNRICDIASAGFDRDMDDEAMRQDTLNHVRGAENLQLSRNEQGEIGGFAMYRRSLWRHSR
jgi:hypothetical protein